MRFTDARARAPHLKAEPIDREADKKALVKLAEWLIRFAPIVTRDGDDGIMLDITGCAHLYGGEQKMLERLSIALEKAVIGHRLGIAGTPIAANAAARYWPGKENTIIPPNDERNALSDLPMASLGLSEESITTLRRFGLTRIGQLYNVPRKSLARRFSPQRKKKYNNTKPGKDQFSNNIETVDTVLLRLDEALGIRKKPLSPLQSPPDFIERILCPEPLLSQEGIDKGLETLSAHLCTCLQAYGQGGRHFTLFAFRTDGTTKSVTTATAAPVNNPNHLCILFKEKIEAIDPGFGIDALALEARRIDTMAATTPPLSGELAKGEIDTVALSALADRLTAKLGENTVYIIEPHDSHLPQKAEKLHRFEGALPKNLTTTTTKKTDGHKTTEAISFSRNSRPLRILQSPEPVTALAALPDGPPARFVWRRVARQVARATGPERIAPEWWHQTETSSYVLPAPQQQEKTRDYYCVEDTEGRRYWLYREGLYGTSDMHCAILPSQNKTNDETTSPKRPEVPKKPEVPGTGSYNSTTTVKGNKNKGNEISNQQPQWFLYGFFA